MPWLDRCALFLSQTPTGGRHLDVGCSSGGTLAHFLELRPDLHFSAVDYQDFASRLPKAVAFHQVNIITEKMPCPDGYFDSITLMHVMEHLPQFGRAPAELRRILKPGGRLYVEGPGPRSVLFPSSAGTITLNFYDDPTHVAPLSKGRIAGVFGVGDLKVVRAGVSRSWPLILAMPLSLVRRDWHHFLAGFIHLGGWSVYVEFRKA